MSGKRENYIDWDTFFMVSAINAKLRSKDPRTQVGAVITKDNHIISTGYNGTPVYMDDDDFPWDSKGEETNDLLQIKNTFVIHAEANALDHCYGQNLNGATLYVTLFPCLECTRRIAQTGIKKIVYLEEYQKPKLVEAAKKIFELAKIEVIKFENIETLKTALNESLMYLKQIEEKREELKITKIRK